MSESSEPHIHSVNFESHYNITTNHDNFKKIHFTSQNIPSNDDSMLYCKTMGMKIDLIFQYRTLTFYKKYYKLKCWIPTMLISTITQKGRVTIPKTIRNALQLKTNDKVIFVRRGDTIIIKPVRDILSLRGVVATGESRDLSSIREKVKNKVSKRIANG